MKKIMGIPGTPSHIEYLRKSESMERRHKARCIYYEDGVCLDIFGNYYSKQCWGSVRCNRYKEVSGEITDEPVKKGRERKRIKIESRRISEGQIENELIIKEHIKRVLHQIDRDLLKNKVPEIEVLVDSRKSVCWCKNAKTDSDGKKDDENLPYLKVGVQYLAKTDCKKIAMDFLKIMVDYAELNNIRIELDSKSYDTKERIMRAGIAGMINKMRRKLGVIKNGEKNNNATPKTSGGNTEKPSESGK